MLVLAFLLVGAVLFLLAAFGVDSPRVSLGWLGALFVTLAFIVTRWP